MLRRRHEAGKVRRRLILRAGLCAGLVAASVLLVGCTSDSQKPAANTPIVGPGGDSTINAAVEAASPGDTIRIHAGTYAEQVEVSKPLTLEPFGDGPVWIDGECANLVGIWVKSSGVTIRGIGAKRAIESTIEVLAADDVTIDGVTLQDYNCQDVQAAARAGIAAFGGVTGLTVTNSTITRRVESPGNLQGYGNGIFFWNHAGPSRGGGHYIAGNTIVGGWDGIGGGPEDLVEGSVYHDTVIEKNTITDCWDDGIQVEGGNIDVVVRDNRIERCPIGIAFAPNLTGPLYIERNVILDNRPGDFGAAACYKVGDGGSGTAYLTENECRIGPLPDTGDGVFQTNAGISTIVSRRNIIQVARYVFATDTTPDFDFDEDCLWTTSPDAFAKWEGAHYGDLVDFQTDTNQEPNGQQTTDCSFTGITPPRTTP